MQPKLQLMVPLRRLWEWSISTCVSLQFSNHKFHNVDSVPKDCIVCM